VTGSQICANSRRPGSHAAARRVRYRDDEHPVASGSPNNGLVSESAGATLRPLARRLNWRGLGPSMVREDRVTMARTFTYLFGTGGTLLLVSLLCLYSPRC